MKTIYVVSVETGEYEQCYSTPMCACSTEEEARTVVASCEAADKRHDIKGNSYGIDAVFLDNPADIVKCEPECPTCERVKNPPPPPPPRQVGVIATIYGGEIIKIEPMYSS